MRILIFTDTYHPNIGGIETATHNQKKALEQDGHEVFVITPNQAGKQKDEAGVIRLPRGMAIHFRHYGLFIASRRNLQRLEEIVKKLNIDIVHIVSDLWMGHAGMAVARRQSIPVIYTPHTLTWGDYIDNFKVVGYIMALAASTAPKLCDLGNNVTSLTPTPNESWPSRRFRSLIFSLSSLADHVTPPSRHLALTLRHWGVQTPITVHPNCFNVQTKTTTAPPSRPTILWLSRMVKQKRPVEFIEAVKKANSLTKVPYRVYMVGRGPLTLKVRKMAHDVANIEFLSGVPNSQVGQLYQRSSFLCLSSYGFDNQPMTIAEALSYGRGVLYRDPKITEGLQSGAGVITTRPTVTSLARHIVKLIESPDKIARMSQSAQMASVIFSVESYNKRLNKIYHTLLESGHGNRQT